MQTLRIVNKNMVGESEHAVLQNIQTNSIYEFSNIIGESIEDNDLTHPIIQQILNNGHQVQAEISENGLVTLHF
jgi:hypothetical protein